MKVTFYKSIKDVSPYQNKDVGFYLDRIKNGKSEQLCKDLRFSTDKEERKSIKMQLPVVTFGGDFSKRNNASLRKASGLLTLDFDEVQDIPALIVELKAHKSIFACWTSPSGNGVKALVKIPIVQDDKEYKEYFKQISAVFNGVDESGKDIARACFESYDPDIYVNLDAENFIIDYDVIPFETSEVGSITNIKVIDTDEIANKLMTWFKKKYNSQNRNSSLYKLAAAFNDFGVDKMTCQNYLIGFEQKDFGSVEILALINSAYKKTANFNTKQFEDKEKKDKLINFVLSGKSDAVILRGV
jgi:phage-related protein